MILIFMRAMANIPIIIMGETGVGKTALVRFMIEVILGDKFHIINFHAGITKKFLIESMEKAE